MKKRLIVFLVLAAVLLFGVSAAFAAGDALTVSMQLSATEFTQPEDITVSIQISNTGDTDLPGAVKLFYPDGTQIEEFGEPVLAAGTQKSWSGSWHVTQEQLEAGRVTFRVQYSIIGEDGAVVPKAKNFAKPITYSGGVVSMEVNRIITPTSAGQGKEVTVTYELINTGTVEITDVTITEDKSISGTAGTIARIPVGEKATHTFTVTMGKKDLTSKSTIAYKAGGESYTVKKEASKIKYGEIKLKATLTADKKGGLPGDTVKLTLTLKNTGKAAYSNLSVSDPVLGVLFSGETVEAGKTLTLEHTVTLTDSADIQLTVTGEDASGNSIEVAADRLALTVIGADQMISLDVQATVESDTVYMLPSIVKFRVYVTNNSAVDVSNVTVSASGLTLYTFPTILAGETREFTRDVAIQMQGQYQFVAACRDQLSQKQSFNSNIVFIRYATPTAAPTKVPLVVPAQPTYVAVPQKISNEYSSQQAMLGNVSTITGALALIGLVLLLVAVVRRVMLAAAHKKSLASLDAPVVRDYEHGEAPANANNASGDDIVVRRLDTDPEPEDLVKPSEEAETDDLPVTENEDKPEV